MDRLITGTTRLNLPTELEPFKTGDIVSDPNYGNGIVGKDNLRGKYPIEVIFRKLDNSQENGLQQETDILYTADGREHLERNPTLQHGILNNWERRLYRSNAGVDPKSVEQVKLGLFGTPEIDGSTLADELARMTKLVDRMHEVLDRNKGNKAPTE